MEPIAIRQASLGDAPALAETVRQGFEGYRAWAPRGWDPPPPQLHLIGIRERLARPDAWCALAEAGTEPAGHGAYLASGAVGLAHLWMLFVREPWWGSGLAADLLARTVAAAARDYAVIRLHTPAGHARARAFYAREGWRQEGGGAWYEPALGLELVEYRRPLPG
jgi:GNAT superfamily N-acetyltransferase